MTVKRTKSDLGFWNMGPLETKFVNDWFRQGAPLMLYEVHRHHKVII